MSVKSREAEEDAPRTVEARAAAYRATLAQDKELMDTFERTYGPIKRDLPAGHAAGEKRPAPRPAAESPSKASAEHRAPIGGRLQCDFAWDELRIWPKRA